MHKDYWIYGDFGGYCVKAGMFWGIGEAADE